MIKVVAKKSVIEDKLEEVIRLYEELVIASRKEDGCIIYELYQDQKDSSIITVIEEWEDNNALEKHMNTTTFLKIVPLISKLTTMGEVNIYNKII